MYNQFNHSLGFCETRIRQIYHYNTTFGSVRFNVLCVTLNILEIICICVILGIFHDYLSIQWLWYPIFECIRIFILTILRIIVLLKVGIDNFNYNRNTFSQLRRCLMFGNLFGGISITFTAFIYLILLPNNDKYQKNKMYQTFSISFLIFIFFRILLSFPLFYALLFGASLFTGYNNYERIDDPNRFGQSRDPINSRNSSNQNPSQPRVSRHVMYQFVEQQQMRLAMERSRQEIYTQQRQEREQQDREYNEALKEQELLLKKNNDNNIDDDNNAFDDINLNDNNNEIKKDEYDFNHMLYNDDTTSEVKKNEDITINNSKQELNIPELPPLKKEPLKNDMCVSIRIRLPNGGQYERLFERYDTIYDVINWVHHECIKHNLIHLINKCQLKTNYPRKVYNNLELTMENIGFWNINSKRKQSPILYVQEI